MASVYKHGIGRLAYKLQDGGTIPGDTLPSILQKQMADKFAGDSPVVERTPKTNDVDALIREYVPPHLREAFGRAPATAEGIASVIGPAADVQDMKNYGAATMDSLRAGDYSGSLANALMTGAAFGMTALPGSVGGIDRAVKKLGVDDLPITPAKENLQTVLDSNFNSGRVVGDEMVPIDSLRGGATASRDVKDLQRVSDLVEEMKGPDGYIERLIVDQDGTVVEGQHRLSALRELGEESVPITRVADNYEGLDLEKVREAIGETGTRNRDQQHYVMQDAAEMLREEGSVKGVLDAYEDVHPAHRAAMESMESQRLPMDTASRMKRMEEMGFNRDVYHASMQDISEFDPAMGYGDGLISTTPDTEFANNWLGLGKHQQRIGAEAEAELADAMAKERALNKEIFDYENLNKLEGDEFGRAYDAAHEKFERLRGPIRAKDTHKTVYPLKTSVQNPFNPDKHFDELDDFFTKNNTSESDKDLYKTGNYLVYETPAMKKYLEGRGFDAMELRESTGGPITTLSVFDPSKLRSRFAEFDPAKKDLPGLSMKDGGVVRAPGVYGQGIGKVAYKLQDGGEVRGVDFASYNPDQGSVYGSSPEEISRAKPLSQVALSLSNVFDTRRRPVLTPEEVIETTGLRETDDPRTFMDAEGNAVRAPRAFDPETGIRSYFIQDPETGVGTLREVVPPVYGKAEESFANTGIARGVLGAGKYFGELLDPETRLEALNSAGRLAVGVGESIQNQMDAIGVEGLDPRFSGIDVDGQITMANPELFAAEIAAGGYGISRFMNSPTGEGRGFVVGMFAGVKSKTADMAAHSRAVKMEAAGKGRRAIWNETGWFQGSDDKWRFEIDDSGAKTLAQDDVSLGKPLQSQDVLAHPELYKSYPDTAGIKTVSKPSKSGGASFDPRTNTIENYQRRFHNLQDKGVDYKSFQLHELQHYLQEKEGFALGGNPRAVEHLRQPNPAYKRHMENLRSVKNAKGYYKSDSYKIDLEKSNTWWKENWKPRQDKLENEFDSGNLSFDDWVEKDIALGKEMDKEKAVLFPNLDYLDRVAKEYGLNTPSEKIGAETTYRRLAGETEARNVQSRMNLTPAQRAATPPWKTEDVPRKKQIIKFADGGVVRDPGVYEQGIGRLAYKLQDGGTPPTNKTAIARALAAFGANFVPGAGVADYIGQLPDMQSGKLPSFKENIEEGRYLDAGLQTLGVAGDAAYAIPGIGVAIGAIAKTPRAIQSALRATRMEPPPLPMDTPKVPSYLMEDWKKSTGLEPEDVALLYKTGDSQRGSPERAMVNFQGASGGGVQSYVFEHLGDLTDRMSARHNPEWAQGESIDKIDKVLRTLEAPYGFRKEMTENVVSNWKFEASSDKTLSFEAYTNKLNDLSLRYAEEHSKIPIYTKVHRLANEATIQNAKGNPDIAAGLLRELRNRIDTKDKFLKEVSEVDRSGTPAITEKELRGYGGGPADPLPMDTASRMKRAEEMGIDLDVFHGTSKNFEEFKIRDLGTHVGTPAQASDINNATSIEKRVTGADYREGANTMPLKARVKNSLRLEDAGQSHNWNIGQLAYELDSKGIPIKGDNFNLTIGDIRDSILDAGYDSIIYKNNYEGLVNNEGVDSLIILDPKNLRSRFAEFDPAKKDLPGLGMRDGGVVPGPRFVPRETRPTVFSTGIPTVLPRVR